jgi:flagellar biosynthesis/type III secretory pathway ATPase
MERAGKTATGSITGFYTVLVEGDDFNEPIPDAVKGISDGHVWLSRSLSNRGHFPAIDILQSISRVRGSVATGEQVRQATRVMSLHAAWRDIEDLVSIGAYVAGLNPEHDLAYQARGRIEMFLRQDSKSPTTLEQAFGQLGELMLWIEQLEKVIRAQAAKANGAGRPADSGQAGNSAPARPAAKPAGAAR